MATDGPVSAVVAAPQTELDLERLVMDLAANGDPLRPAELLLAQSVIFHAIDYARSLGFEPHRDFVAGLIGERPAVLLETPLCRPERPLYVAGSHDNVDAIVSKLVASVGPDGYDWVGGLDEFGDDLDVDDTAFDDDEVLTVEGIEVPAGVADSARWQAGLGARWQRRPHRRRRTVVAIWRRRASQICAGWGKQWSSRPVALSSGPG